MVFNHGWQLSGDDWDTQMLFFFKHGYRFIAQYGAAWPLHPGRGNHDMGHSPTT